MKNRDINVIGLEFDCNEYIDSDHLGSILVDNFNRCIRSIDDTAINIIKIDVGNMPLDSLSHTMDMFRKMFKRQQIKNCVFVPISNYRGIRDVKVDKIEVVHHN